MSGLHTLNQLRTSPEINSISDPAAGANFSATFGTREWWLIDILAFRLTTDANVANRRVAIYFGSGAPKLWYALAPGVQTASTVIDYCFFIGAGTGVDASAQNFMTAALPERAIYEASEGFGSSIANLQAGDQLTRIAYRTEIWFDPVYPL